MRVPNFVVNNHRSVRYAACDPVPRVMIITGPNGSGKSTLLQALRNHSGSGPILYVGPHRMSRRQQVRMRFLYQQKIEMSKLLASPNLPNFEGIYIPNNQRDAWDFDEASSFLKYGLCQIELDRQTAITEKFDQLGHVEKDALPDVWQPLREITENLLPHLHFHKIDVTNRDGVLCLWEVHKKNIYVDIDDLSSGEKSIIQLFFPLIEHQIQAYLGQIKGIEEAQAQENICVLMDEPELHLHPNLQGKILDYIRNISLRENVQFILASHSPTIVEQASSEELFLLRPAELVSDDTNQLIKIASNDEKLELMREVFGSTSNITAMRPILVVEGGQADGASRKAADTRVYSFLSDQFNQLSVIPAGGKSECIKLAGSLTDIVRQFSPQLKAYALLDKDVKEIEEGTPDGQTIYLPVSTIENLLVDPQIIWDAIATVRHKIYFSSAVELESALNEILTEMESKEIERRVKASIGAQYFRLQSPVEEAKEQIDRFIATLQQRFSEEQLSALRTEAQEQVGVLKNTNRRREHFDGKAILNEFYRRHLLEICEHAIYKGWSQQSYFY